MPPTTPRQKWQFHKELTMTEARKVSVTCRLTLGDIRAIREIKMCLMGFRSLATQPESAAVTASKLQCIVGMIELIHEWCDLGNENPWDWPDEAVAQCCEAMIGLGAADSKKSGMSSVPLYEIAVTPRSPGCGTTSGI